MSIYVEVIEGALIAKVLQKQFHSMYFNLYI